MSLLPEWAPSIHPMIVHFPIALLFAAGVADLVSVAPGRLSWLRRTTVALYAAGAVAALIAMRSGQVAAGALQLPPAAQAILHDHEEWGERTVWYFGILALVRLVAMWRDHQVRLPLRAVLLALGLGGLLLVLETGEHGAQLVFQQGVGVRAQSGSAASPSSTATSARPAP